MSLRRYIDIVESGGQPTPIRLRLDDLIAWGESIGIYASATEDAAGIHLHEFQRNGGRGEGFTKGRGADFLQALCAYADRKGQPITLSVIGANSELEDYYARFGFEAVEHERDEETGDVMMLRDPKRDIHLWERRL